MSILYLNNKYICSNDDLLSTFELLIDDYKRPEFLQDEILEAFYSRRLTDYLKSKPGMENTCEKVDDFRKQCCQDSDFRNGRNDIIKKLSVLIFDESYNLTYNCEEFLRNLEVSLFRNNKKIDRNAIMHFNKNVIKDGENLCCVIEGEAAKIINDKIIFVAKVYKEDGTESKEITPITFNLNLSNRKQNDIVMDKKSININTLKSLKEGSYKLVIEDQNGHAIDDFEFINEYEDYFEMPIKFLEYSISEQGILKDGVFFNRKDMVEEYIVTLKFEVLESCNATIKLGISCEDFNFDYKEDDNPLRIYGKRKGDIVTHELHIKCNDNIRNASDGRHKIIISPFKSIIEFTNVNVYIFGTSRFVRLTNNTQSGNSNDCIEFISFCNDSCISTVYISKNLINTSMFYDAIKNKLLSFELALDPTTNQYKLGDVANIISILNENSKVKYFLTPFSILQPFMKNFFVEGGYDTPQFTSDKCVDEGWFTDTIKSITILDNNNTQKVIETGWDEVKYPFRLCFRD